MKKEQVWVHPDFKELLKKKAAENRMNILEFSQRIEDFQLNLYRFMRRHP